MNTKQMVLDGSGNEVIILKGPVPFSDEIQNEMEADWDSYLGLELEDENDIKGNWYYTRVIRVIDGPSNIGYECWYNEDELYFEGKDYNN